MSVGTTLSLQIRNNSIIITANKLFCRNFCSRVRQVTGWMHQLTGTCEPAAIIHYEKPTQSATAALWPCNWPSEEVGGLIQNSDSIQNWLLRRALLLACVVTARLCAKPLSSSSSSSSLLSSSTEAVVGTEFASLLRR